MRVFIYLYETEAPSLRPFHRLPRPRHFRLEALHILPLLPRLLLYRIYPSLVRGDLRQEAVARRAKPLFGWILQTSFSTEDKYEAD